MDVFDSIDAHIPSWVLTLIIVLGSIGALLLVKRLILGRLIRITDKTRYHFDSLLLRSIKLPLTLVIVWVGLLPLDKSLTSDSPAINAIQGMARYILPILLIFAVVIFIDRLISGLITHYSKRSTLLLSSQSIVKGISRSFIIGIGVLILLGTLGISITPIIASLGIGSLALALALQPTLENFFSGMQLVMDKPIQVGDYIELESGEQGFVDKIGWRSTWIRMLPNNTIIMPNSMLSESKIINYFHPTKELSVPVEVSVHYDSDLEQVERVALEVARDILISHEYGVESYNTFVVFHTFADSSINLTVMLRAHEYFHRFFIKSAYIKALHKRFKEEGIVIPYPIRAVNTDQEAANLTIHNKG